MAGFHLTKWYLDAIAPDGSAVIGYWARMSWGLLSVRYSAVMEVSADPTNPVIERVSLMNPAEPEVSRKEVHWSVPRLPIDARWLRAGPPAALPGMHRELLDGGAVRWECLLPVAHVKGLQPVGSTSRSSEHWGYGERLTLAMEPWQIPADEVRWGRVAHPTLSVVWIDWRGARPLTAVFVDGQEQPAATVADDLVTWKGGEIKLTPRRTIRDLTLGDGPVKSIPFLSKALPARMLETHETKWLSEAVLPSGLQTFAIHEAVTFGGAGAAR